MVYIVGIVGFVFGFFFGQMMLSQMLRGYSRKDILKMMEDKGARLKYGALNWAIALTWAVAFVYIYRLYFQ